jgi:hypothetical protein
VLLVAAAGPGAAPFEVTHRSGDAARDPVVPGGIHRGIRTESAYQARGDLLL